MAKELSAGVGSLRVPDQFLDEVFCIDWKRALRIPSDHGPSPDRSAALRQRRDTDVGHAREPQRRPGIDRTAVAA
jgi:hypothetical protein